MSCFQTKEIDPSECIGNSLTKINTNFTGLKFAVCDNDSFITTLRNSIDNLSTIITNLSSVTVTGIARAWIKFDGTRRENGITETPATISTTNRFIYSSFNVSTVYRKGPGDYRITFTAPFTTSNYVIVGTSSQKQASNGQLTWFQPYVYRTEYVDVRIAGTNIQAVADPEHCSLVVF